MNVGPRRHPVQRAFVRLLAAVGAGIVVLAGLYVAHDHAEHLTQVEVERLHHPAALLGEQIGRVLEATSVPAGMTAEIRDEAAAGGAASRNLGRSIELFDRLAALYAAAGPAAVGEPARARVARARAELAALAESTAGDPLALARALATRELYAKVVAAQVRRLHTARAREVQEQAAQFDRRMQAALAVLAVLVIAGVAWQSRRALRGIDVLLRAEQDATDGLRLREAQLEEAQAVARVGSWELDHAGGALHWSVQVFRIFEIDPARFGASYEAFLALVHPDDRAELDRVYRASVEQHTDYAFAHRLLMPDGRIKHVRERGRTVYDAGGRPLRSYGTVQDVSDEVRAEALVRESAARFEAVLAHSSLGVVLMTPDWQLVRCNEAFCRMLGYGEAEIAALGWDALTHPDDRGRNPEPPAGVVEGEAAGQRFVKRYLHRSGTVVWANMITVAVRDASGRTIELVAQVEDITAQRAAEDALREANARSEAVLAAVPDLWFVIDADGRYLDVSADHHPSLASDWQTLRSQPFTDVFEPATAARAAAALARARDRGTLQHFEYTIAVHGSGERRAFEARIAPMRDGRWLYLTRDITELRRQQARLEAALAEKEMLLREIYHRVKNNLQVVASLLTLQGGAVGDAAARALLAESADRVKSMALVHEQLLGGGDPSAVAFHQYLARLAQHLEASHGEAAARSPIHLALAPLTLGLETAVPLGLIVNELVANAYKHAFPGDRRGAVRIALAAADDGVVALTVADDGVGLPAQLSLQAAKSLGLTLVRSLAEQIGARIAVDAAGGGVRFTLRFVPDDAERRRLVAPAPAEEATA